MDIWVGTTNQAKVHAVQSVFQDGQLQSINVDSGVSEQPFSDEETMQGAIHRAKEALPDECSDETIAIGLEGGVMEIDQTLFICNWGALVTSTNDVYVASGARIPLPQEVANELYSGKELGPVMQTFSQKENVRQTEGAIGIFTNERLNRSDMFSHIVLMLKGQWEYDKHHKNI